MKMHLLFLIMFIVDYSIIYEWITHERMISMGMISMPRECMNGAVLNHQRHHRAQVDHT
jgi:hypothetical protein